MPIAQRRFSSTVESACETRKTVFRPTEFLQALASHFIWNHSPLDEGDRLELN